MTCSLLWGKWPEKRICGNHSVYCCKNCQRKRSPVIIKFTVANMAREKDLRWSFSLPLEKWPDKKDLQWSFSLLLEIGPEKRVSGDHSVYCWKNGLRKGSPVISEFTVGKNDQRKGSPVMMQFAVGKKNSQRKGSPIIMQFTVGKMAREKAPEKRISGDQAVCCWEKWPESNDPNATRK